MINKIENFVLLLFALTIVNSQSNNTLGYLNEVFHNASVYMQREAQYEDIAIFIGTTKSGKSTLINYLLGNPLISAQERLGQPITIKKADNSSGPAIGAKSASETKTPSRWTSKHFSNMILWDSPGFEDNRGPQQDITNAFYMYQLLQKIKSLRIILVVDINAIANENIIPFLSVLNSLENMMQPKMTDCFQSISVIFSKAPKILHEAQVDKNYLKSLLKSSILDAKEINITPVSRNFVEFLINNEKHMGIFRRVDKLGNVTSDIDVDIFPAILNSVPVQKDIVQEMNPSISYDSASYLHQARDALFSKKIFQELQNTIINALNSKIIYYNAGHKKQMTRNEVKEFIEESTKFENQLYNIRDHCERVREKIEILQTIDPTIKRKFEEHNLIGKIMLGEFVHKVLKLEENNLWESSLNEILMSSILKLQHVSCSVIPKGLKMQVTGRTINLRNINIDLCGENVKYVEIFASEKVLIDADVNMVGREIHLTIIAPVWEILGIRTITLNGNNAQNHLEYQAKSGSSYGNRNGADGLSGLPGGSAGNFYGVAGKINNAQQLSILANGGSGGNGQKGGNGANGSKGPSFKNKDSSICEKENTSGWKREGPYCINCGYKDNGLVTYYIVQGKEGTIGGRSGNGGSNGLGGYKGSILLFELSKNDNKSSVAILASDGIKGGLGDGGIPGLGGEYGNNTSATCTEILFAKYNTDVWEASNENILYASPGKQGVAGKSLKKRILPKTIPVVQNLAFTINEYKAYARSQLAKNNRRAEQLESFYQSLNTQKEITNLYDIVDLVEEFSDLEFQYFTLQNAFNFTSSYIELRDRIHNYEKENNMKYFTVIRNLFYSISRKIETLNKPKLYPVMTDVKSGIETFKREQIEALKTVEKLTDVLDMLDSIINRLNGLIEEAQYLINVDLKKAMQDLETSLDQEIDTLLQEISELKKRSLDKEAELLENREKLKKMVLLKTVFGVLKVGCGLLSFINPAFGIVSSIIGVGEAFLLQPNISTQLTEVPKAVQALATSSENFLKKDKENNVLEEQKNTFSEIVQSASVPGQRKMWDIYNNIAKKFDTNNAEPVLVNYRRLSSEEIFENEEKEINALKNKAEKSKDRVEIKDSKIADKALKYLKGTHEVLKTISDTTTSVMKDVNKMDEVSKAIEENRGTLNRLKNFEEQIYSDTQPMLTEIIDFVDQAGTNMSHMNENQLLIANWKVVDTMENVQRILDKSLEGFNTTDTIHWTFNKLVKTFNKITDMYQNILEYNTRKSEAEYMAMLHLASESQILVGDNHLTKALATLNKAIVYNSVYESYEKWTFAFKQFTFPYGGNILQKTEWPDKFVNKNISYVIGDIKKNCKELEKIFDSNFAELSINKRRRDFLGSNSSNHLSFFVWSNERYGKHIQEILSGNEVTLFANILAKSMDALKFNRVGILFTSKNPNKQEELNEILKGFSVILTHHGDSLYKFKKRVFEIKTSSTVLSFELPTTTYELPSGQSELYIKIANGDYMLSPYARWTIKLVAENDDNYKSLNNFVDPIDLELVGKGQFIFDIHEQTDILTEAAILKYYPNRRSSLLK